MENTPSDLCIFVYMFIGYSYICSITILLFMDLYMYIQVHVYLNVTDNCIFTFIKKNIHEYMYKHIAIYCQGAHGCTKLWVYCWCCALSIRSLPERLHGSQSSNAFALIQLAFCVLSHVLHRSVNRPFAPWPCSCPLLWRHDLRAYHSAAQSACA